MSAAPLAAAQDYPLLNLFWTMLWLFLWILWIFLLVRIILDIFRSDDLGGWGKAGWVIFIIILPFLGVLIYLIANHDGMMERRVKETQAAQAQFDAYVRQTAGSGGAAGEIEKAKQLLDSGAINQQEFESLKAKALAG